MNKFISFFRFLGLLLSWAVIGFGERLWNYVITIIIIALTFTLLFHFLPDHFEIKQENCVSTGCERFVHCCYISINIMTSLDMGGMIPKTNIARLCIICEVILGYIMLAVLVAIMIRRIIQR